MIILKIKIKIKIKLLFLLSYKIEERAGRKGNKYIRADVWTAALIFKSESYVLSILTGFWTIFMPFPQ